MKTFFTILLATLCAATSYGQTMKALSYNASNGVVAFSGTNDLQLPSAVKFGGDTRIISSIFQFGGVDRISLEETRFVGDWTFAGTITFEAAASVRTNLGLGATWLTNANVTNFRTAIGLGVTNDVTFETVNVDQLSWEGNLVFEPETGIFWTDIGFENPTNAAITRTNLGLPLPALTNTNNANFQAAVFNTNTTPAGSAFNTIVAWMEVHVFTNGSNTSFRIPLFK
jgi:hypothetical protein